jgi:HAE1 family hydrophobic/amphiphilic exporter-1
MVCLGLMLIGAVSLTRIPVDLLPEINYPRLTVVTQYADVQAEDVERLVTMPLEAAVTSLPKVRRVESRSREGLSTITVEYEWGTDMEFAALHLREGLDRVAFRTDYPEEAERPLILRWDPTSRPVSIMVVRGEKPLREITEFAIEVAKPALEQIHGVSQADVVGGLEREIRVEPDPGMLRVYNISMEQIAAALRSSNISFPGGRVRQGPLHLSLRIIGEFENLAEIEETAIGREGLSPIRLGDIATVIDDVKEPEGATLLHGDEVVSILLYKEVGANTVSVSEEVDVVLDVLREQYTDFSAEFVYRDAEFIRASFSGLLQSLLFGALLAFIVLFMFLGDLRSPIVVGIAIPASIMTTFAFLYLTGVKLNLMSLGGLSLAAGMLVDNAIVVLENITRHIQEKRGGGGTDREMVRANAITGTREVSAAVMASTLTTVAVFFPVVYVSGVAGEFFRDQALTVTFSLLISGATALLLQPTLSARILGARMPEPRGLFRLFSSGLKGFYNVYHRVLIHALDRKAVWMVGLIVFLVGAAIVGWALPRSFLPERSTGDLSLAIELPAGTPLEETQEMARRLAEEIETLPQVATVFSQVGTTERTLAAVKEFTGSQTASLRIILKSGQAGRRESEALEDHVADYLATFPSVLYAFREEGIGLREILGTGGAPFMLGIMAEDAEDAVVAADLVLAALADVRGLVDLKADRVLGTPILAMRIDREEAVRSNLDPEFLGRELRNRIQGVVATTFNEAEQRIDIAVRFSEDERKNLAAVLAAPVEVSPGRMVRLGRFVDVVEEVPVRELVRRDQRRMVTITGDVRGRRADHVRAEVRDIIATLDLPPDVRFAEGGEQEEISESFRELGYALLLAVLIVYMILAGMFESFLDPLLIAAVLPLGVAGAALTLSVFGQSVNILSLIGLVALIGISVNDAIIKIDTIRRLRRKGMALREAVLEGTRLRFRPILMTSVTTVVGMTPMAIGLGSGEQLQRPLALTIIGGLTLATLLTLIYTPLFYEWVHARRARKQP